MTENLGPLPQGDRKDELQELSFQAFQSLLPIHQFRFRDERGNDKGVDASIEVIVGHGFANCRAQAQIKGTDADPEKEGNFNSDGSYSLSVSTANLNYLLNGSSPIYVVWFSKLNEVRYVWARDAACKLNADNPTWMQQDTVTLRFSEVLSSDALTRIHRRILDESRMNRRIHESVLRSAPAENIVVSIDAHSLRSSDPVEIFESLSECGMTYVSAGFGKKVLEQFALLNSHQANAPRILLIAAFAAFSVARFHDARAYLSQVSMQLKALSPDDMNFYEFLTGACLYQTGQMSCERFAEFEFAWSQRLTGVWAKDRLLNSLRLTRLGERNLEKRSELLAEIQGLVNEIISDAHAHMCQKVQARLTLMSAEGDDFTVQLVEMIGKAVSRKKYGLPPNRDAIHRFEQFTLSWMQWESRNQQLYEDAVAIGHPILVADVITARAVCYTCLLTSIRMANMMQNAVQDVPASIVDKIAIDLDRAVEAYRHAGNYSGELQSLVVRADLLALSGDYEAGKRIAAEVLPVAEAMSYDRIVAQARLHVNGTTVTQMFEDRMINAPSTDDIAVAQSDEDIRRAAEMALGEFGIPAGRVSFVEKDLFAGRYIAQVRLDWCRHLELEQDMTHAQHPATFYESDPHRYCLCTKLNRKSTFGDCDYEFIVQTFKSVHCEGCAHREPRFPRA